MLCHLKLLVLLLQKHKLFEVTDFNRVKHLLIAYFIGNISAKKISKCVHVCHQSYSKSKVERFLRHSVVAQNTLNSNSL